MFHRLREETQSQHASIENSLDLFNRVLTLKDYRTLLARFYGFYVPLEARLSNMNLEESCEIDFALRKKAPLLLNDLRFLGMSDEEIANLNMATASELPPLETPEDAMGVLYVIEGSTLGGQIISRHFREKFGFKREGLEFFTSYGADVGHFWRDLRDACEIFVGTQAAPAEASDQVIRSAKVAFKSYENWSDFRENTPNTLG